MVKPGVQIVGHSARVSAGAPPDPNARRQLVTLKRLTQTELSYLPVVGDPWRAPADFLPAEHWRAWPRWPERPTQLKNRWESSTDWMDWRTPIFYSG